MAKCGEWAFELPIRTLVARLDGRCKCVLVRSSSMDEYAFERPDGAGSGTRRSGGSAAAGPDSHLRLLGEGAAVILFYLVLVVSFMWPLVLDPFNQVFRPSNLGSASDQNLIIWILAWDWHALTTAPLSLFDANIYHPALNTLAGSEHLLGVVPLSGPLYALTGNPVFAYTATHVLTLTLCGAAMYALLRHWGVVRTGALFGGFVYALYPSQTHGGPALQMISRQYLPLVLIFLDLTLQNARVRSAIALSGFLLWHMLCSVYLAFIGASSLFVYGFTFFAMKWRSISLRGLALVLGAVGAAAMVLVLIHLPYLELRDSGVITDYFGHEALKGLSSGPWRDWLLPPISYRAWGFQTETGLRSYLGLLPLLSAGCILVCRRRETASWAAPAAFAILLGGYLLALGASVEVLGHSVTLPYAYLAEWVPGFSSMRVPSRFSIATMTGLAALAGIGLGRAVAPLEARAHGKWLAAAVLALMLSGTAVEYDLPFTLPQAKPVPVGDGIPPIYTKLAELPEGPLLEYPWHGAQGWHTAAQSASYMYFSTFHWKRLLNGYTGYPAPSARVTAGLVRALPGAQALEILKRATGVRYILVHASKLPPVERSKWTNPVGLKLIERSGADFLFEVAEPVNADLIDVMREGPPAGHTLLGTPIEMISLEERRADIRFTIPPRPEIRPGSVTLIQIEVKNDSNVPWPAFAGNSPQLVSVDHRLLDLETGSRVSAEWAGPRPGPLPYDLLPGESVRVEFMLSVPRDAGNSVLEVGLQQDGEWFEGSVLRRTINIRPPDGAGARTDPARIARHGDLR